jgi:hypothetical protein
LIEQAAVDHRLKDMLQCRREEVVSATSLQHLLAKQLPDETFLHIYGTADNGCKSIQLCDALATKLFETNRPALDIDEALQQAEKVMRELYREYIANKSIRIAEEIMSSKASNSIIREITYRLIDFVVIEATSPTTRCIRVVPAKLEIVKQVIKLLGENGKALFNESLLGYREFKDVPPQDNEVSLFADAMVDERSISLPNTTFTMVDGSMLRIFQNFLVAPVPSIYREDNTMDNDQEFSSLIANAASAARVRSGLPAVGRSTTCAIA